MEEEKVVKLEDMKVGDTALSVDGQTVVVRVPATQPEIETFLKDRPKHRILRPAGQVPMPQPSEMEKIAEERRESVSTPSALDVAKTSANALEVSSAAPGLFYANAPHLVERVPQQPSATLQVLKVEIDDLLSEQARALGDKEIRSTLHVFEENNLRYVVPCEYASKIVDLGPDGEVPEEYVRRWANFLNDMAARGIWKYGTLQKCSFIEICTLNAAKRQGVILSFIFVNREVYKPGVSAVESLAELNKTVGSDVFRPEGNVGTNDWNPAAFPW